jgi:hypothetical protein
MQIMSLASGRLHLNMVNASLLRNSYVCAWGALRSTRSTGAGERLIKAHILDKIHG